MEGQYGLAGVLKERAPSRLIFPFSIHQQLGYAQMIELATFRVAAKVDPEDEPQMSVSASIPSCRAEC